MISTVSRIRGAFGIILILLSASAVADRRSGDCGKVDHWMEVINEWSLGRDLNKEESQYFRQLISPAFHDEVMSDIWGDSYAEMSDRQRASIHGILRKCSKEPWVSFFLTIPFTNPPERVKQARGSDFERWQSAIKTVNSQSYAQLKSQRQQQVAASERAIQRRVDAIAAAQARKQQIKQIQKERLRLAQQETDRRIALVNKHAASGPFRGTGASYLNALYLDDRETLTEYDRMFSAAFTEAIGMYEGSAMDALGRVFFGSAGSNRLGQNMQAMAANLSMVTSVVGVYVLYYEHVYPDCMDDQPLVYKHTREYEWVTTNSMGTVLSRSPGWSETDTFNINRRFKYAWEHMDDIEKSNAVLSDLFFGKRGAIRLSDAMTGMSRSMRQFSCDSKEMQQLESNMLSYFRSCVDKMNHALD